MKYEVQYLPLESLLSDAEDELLYMLYSPNIQIATLRCSG